MKILILIGSAEKLGGVLTEIIGKNFEPIIAIFLDGIRAFVRLPSNIVKLDKLIPNVEKITGNLNDITFLSSIQLDEI